MVNTIYESRHLALGDEPAGTETLKSSKKIGVLRPSALRHTRLAQPFAQQFALFASMNTTSSATGCAARYDVW